MEIMRFIRYLAMAGVVSGLVSGCTIPLENGPEHARTVSALYPVQVEPRVVTLTLRGDSSGTLAESDAARVSAFVETWRERGYGALGISEPADGRASSLVAGVRRLLEENEVGGDAVRASTHKANAKDIKVSLSFMTDVGLTEPCGESWPENLAESPRNLPWAGFGCWSQQNIAVLVEDPRDLKRPRTTATADAARRSTVLDKYRKGESTSARRDEQQEGGQVSTVAQ